MNSELKYISKGLLYFSLLSVAIFAIYKIVSYNQEKSSIKKQPPIITYNDLISTPEVSTGKRLFEQNCLACHKIHATDQTWFHNIINRNYNKKDLYSWIRNSDSVIRSGNKYYVELYNVSNKTQMTSFPNLTDKKIDEIIDYIKVEIALNHYFTLHNSSHLEV